MHFVVRKKRFLKKSFRIILVTFFKPWSKSNFFGEISLTVVYNFDVVSC